MKTQIVKNFHIDAPTSIVWKSLSDPQDIVSCVPGASITEKIDEQNYKGQVVTKFGPIKASYAGDIEILELDEANNKMVLKGKGLDSKGKGSADMDMVGILSEKDGGTDVSFTMDITIIGKLAQFGSRLIGDVSDQLLEQFVANYKNKLASQVNETPDIGKEKSIDSANPITEETKPIPAELEKKIEEPQSDNTLNATSLMGTVVKSIFGSIGDFFKSLFGGNKS